MNQFVKTAQANPSKIFESPEEVLSSNLSHDDKLAVLKSWEDEARQLQSATAENMTGGESPRLEEISKAILALNDRTEK